MNAVRFRKRFSALAEETTNPKSASLNRGLSCISFKLERCRPADIVIPSTPASNAAFNRAFSVAIGSFIVSFSMQFTRTRPLPVAFSITSEKYCFETLDRASKLNFSSVLSASSIIDLNRIVFSFVKCVPISRSATSGSIASERWAIPPSFSIANTRFAVEILVPIPPTISGKKSRPLKERRKSSKHCIPKSPITKVRRFNIGGC